MLNSFTTGPCRQRDAHDLLHDRGEVMTEHWAVTVFRNGEEIVTIESNCLSGRELSQEDEETIRNAAEYLLSFVGRVPPHQVEAG